jgi:hypothetical protein
LSIERKKRPGAKLPANPEEIVYEVFGFTVALKPAFLTASINCSCETLPGCTFTVAESGILTSALRTPGTLESADCTFFTQPTGHVMPVTARLMVSSDAFLAGA